MKCSYIQRDVGCPYYRGDDGAVSITCEGIMEGSTTRTRFARKEEWTVWVQARCAGAWESCPFFALAALKHEAEEGG